jgi:hypothetical protein
MSSIRAVHIVELRSALAQAYAAAGRAAPQYTDPGLGAATTVRAVHVAELRGGVRGLE